MLNNLVAPRKRLLVIGGGAAGFFCAVNAARMQPLLDVTIIEKSSKLLSKVRISGGGRCNVTHACFEISSMIKFYPRGANFVKKAFHRFFTTDTIQWFKERQVLLKTEADGRMFPESNTSQTIVDCLMKEVQRYKVSIMLNAELKSLQQLPGGQWAASIKNKGSIDATNETGAITSIRADYVCIASGGYPKAAMFNWIRLLGHQVADPVPSLFTFNMPGHPITQLMGISVENARVRLAGSKLETTGPLLITHWGLSGPAVLKLSAWGARSLAESNYHFTAIVNWLPQYNLETLRASMEEMRRSMAAQKLSNKNAFGLPARLWAFLLEQAGVKETLRWADLPSAVQNKLVNLLCAYECSIQGKTTFKEEFVTAGGVQLSEVDPNTMMSRKQSNLFFAGEILDVDGVTGGFNFQHAWTSGWIAANSIASKATESVSV